MRTSLPNTQVPVVFAPRLKSKWLVNSFWLCSALLITNVLTFRLASPAAASHISGASAQSAENLYLSAQLPHTIDPASFQENVRQVADALQVPADWLMAVMYMESRFDGSIYNHKGSGAVGLIQFMPATAQELGTSTFALSQLPAVAQLPYVQAYFDQVRHRYGAYQSLTDLYLAVLFPKARGQDPCFQLYHRPSKAYRQNKGLDTNHDGAVTVSDIDQLLRARHPHAYHQSI